MIQDAINHDVILFYFSNSIELKYVINQLTSVLGEDVSNYVSQSITRTYSKPAALQSIQQSSMIVRVNSSISCIVIFNAKFNISH